MNANSLRPLSLCLALAVAAPLSGCGLDGATSEDDFSEFATQGNWADQDTNGVGTHRITGDYVNVRGDDLSQVLFAARVNTQVVLSYETQDYNGFTYYEAYIKSGDNAGQRGWVALDFLAHSVLQVCRGNGINLRTGDQLETVVGTASSGDRAYVVSGTVRNTGTHRYFDVSVNGLQGFVATDYLCGGGSGGSFAEQIMGAHNADVVTLWDQTFGRFDGADPLSNIRDTINGLPAKTSCYGTAPCTTVTLKDGLLEGMARLISDYNFSYFVTSITGASHSRTSFHYQGRSVDMDLINGVKVNGDSPQARAIMQACRELGAIEVLGPSNDVNHQDHIHCTF